MRELLVTQKIFSSFHEKLKDGFFLIMVVKKIDILGTDAPFLLV